MSRIKSIRLSSRRLRPLQGVSVSFMLIALVAVLSPGAFAEDWLQWGGPNGDFTVDAKGLAESWPTEGPRQLWKRPLGDGYSSILCKGGQLFTEYSSGDEGVVISLHPSSLPSHYAGRRTDAKRVVQLQEALAVQPRFHFGPGDDRRRR